MEAAHVHDWLRIVCKGSRGLIYFLALGWLIWFVCTCRLRARKAEYLLFAGLPLLLAFCWTSGESSFTFPSW